MNVTMMRTAAERRLAWPWVLWLVAMGLLALLAGTGCRATGGKGYSYHRVENWATNATGKPYLAFRETWKDKNSLVSAGVLASANATALAYARSNHLGTHSTMSLGKYADKPEAQAIKEAGSAAGGVISGAVKGAVGQ